MTEGPVRVWDLPTRVFHWALLAGVLGLFATALAPGAPVELHARFGYFVLSLLIFRLVWGFVGGHWSRFGSFVPTRRRLAEHFGRQASRERLPGHSLLGALSVLAMLAVLLIQVSTGLLADDEIAFTGPLNRLVSTSTGLAATSYHKGLGKWLLVALIALHLVAIGFYDVVRRRRLTAAMLHGDQVCPGGSTASRDGWGPRLLALVVFLLSGTTVWLLVSSSA